MTNPTAPAAKQRVTQEGGIGALHDYPNERAPCDPGGAACKGDMLTRQQRGTVFEANERSGDVTPVAVASVHNSTVMLPDMAIGAQGAPSFEHHDFRDFPGDLKRDPGRDWEREQGREYLPGIGR